jgi:DNA-directed RNA polymerase specialized sigma24 family protein
MRAVDGHGKQIDIEPRGFPRSAPEAIRRVYLSVHPQRENWFMAWKLRHVAGETKAAIARMLGVDRSTVGRQIDRTETEIRKIFSRS